MTNSLLDFVMGLVRDPAAAAQYAADPAEAIAAAGLTDVTSADVDQLVPVVTESFGASESLGAASVPADANVWASGAATAAFDAFGIDDSLPVHVSDLDDLSVPAVVDTFDGTDGAPSALDDVLAAPDVPVSPVFDDVPVLDPVFESEVPVWDAPEVPDTAFDVFD